MADYDWFDHPVEPSWQKREREKEEARKQPIIDLGFDVLLISSPAYMGSTQPLEVYVCQSCSAIVANATVHRGVCEI